MKTILIGGMGNVLLGDDGLGAYVVHLLESQYQFADVVELADLGTPALDLTHRIAGREAVILIDCVASSQHRAGTILLYDKPGLLAAIPGQRLDPHSPALSECLLMAEMLGASPENVLLVGSVGESFEPGCGLSGEVRQSLDKVVGAVLGELTRLRIPFTRKAAATEPGIWWQDVVSVDLPRSIR